MEGVKKEGGHGPQLIHLQQVLRSLVPQLSSLPEAPAEDQVSSKTLNQAASAPSAEAASSTAAMYTRTGP